MEKTRLSEAVKELTSLSHQALEKLLVKVIRQINSVQDYKQLLQLFYGYYEPVEKLISLHLHPGSPVPAEIRKSERLLSDIVEIEPETKGIPISRLLPPVQTHVQALGALYVLEGSTLGGKYILQMIRKKIRLQEGTADAFLSGHGSNTELNWKCFKDYLDEEVTEADKEIFLEAVNETFDQFRNWAQLNYEYVEQEKL